MIRTRKTGEEEREGQEEKEQVKSGQRGKKSMAEFGERSKHRERW